MNIVVCMKQVPATSRVEIDPETGTLIRLGAESRTNPYDLYALETALRIRERTGGRVTVLTMGPPQAEQMMQDAYRLGADDAVILSDRKFAGSDVLATSYTLSQGIRMLGIPDLILCGRQTTDGDTAQIGPALAEHLGIPHAAWVGAILKADKKSIEVRQTLASVTQISRLKYPCLVTVEKDICVPRLPSYRLKRETAGRPVRVLGFRDLPETDLSLCGLVGSPTRVESMFSPPENPRKVMLEGDTREKASALVAVLREKKLVEGGEAR
ncbi:electron transfer flavoprotein subunit beta/FixA family protein [Papillibacter cinnamivorans]|uniref:Electron transfer flavoprotein small subunit n=1 Tax=Papillibacter cinnamivorans DSM 12816 TaxID=1122930 RepID=A0A1W2C0G8_9FIRM|nr:electron transfer flavoprotein subunit beta/FixA family protein [Papillibacter cinnamivorans]SMC78683.1 electron transfer flavoprotein beta subunit [Papillibacter cinnamivorans DSM 12816]